MGYTTTTFDKEANIMYHDVHIDDYNYFSMIDNQIRSEYTLCEEFTLLPKILKLYEDNGISSKEKDLVHYPTEGYYYKTPGLTRFFQLVRNLQENPSVYKKIKPSIEVDELVWLFGKSIWGTVVSERSKTIFPRMKDILTHSLNYLQLAPLWTIPNIMDTLPKFATGNPNLVELAYLTGDIRCLTAGAETNALYREMGFCMSGCCVISAPPKDVYRYHWDVKENVQSLGEKLVDLYNEILNKFQKEFAGPSDGKTSYTASLKTTYIMLPGMSSDTYVRKLPKLIQKPTVENHSSFKNNLESPRVAMLGQMLDSPMHYHWILDNDKVTEKWAAGVITTENYINKTGPELFDKWDMSGVKDADGKTNLGKLWSTNNPKFDHPEIVPGIVQTKDMTVLWNDPNYNMARHE